MKNKYLSVFLILIFTFSVLYTATGCKAEEPDLVKELEEEKTPSEVGDEEKVTKEVGIEDEGELKTYYLPEILDEDSIIAGDNQGVVGPKTNHAVGTSYGHRMPVYSFISWDITGLEGKSLENAELTFISNKTEVDPLCGEIPKYDNVPFSLGPLYVMAVDWGEKHLMPEDFYTEGEIIATSTEPDFKISDGKLKEEIQKAIDNGKSRFQIKVYFDYDEVYPGRAGYVGIIGYKLGQIKLKVSARGIEITRDERPSHAYLADGVTGVSYLYRVFIQTPRDIAYGPDGYLYIADENGRHIVTISPEGEIGDMGIWKDPNVWQTFWNHQHDTWAPWETWHSPGPNSVAFDSSGKLYISDQVNIYSVNDDYSLEILPSVGGTDKIAFGPDGKLYYTRRGAHREGRGKVMKIDSNGESVTVADGLTGPVELVISQDGTVYTNDGDSIVKIDPETHEVSKFYSKDVIEGGPKAIDSEGDIWVSGWIGDGFKVVQLSPEGKEKPYYIDGKIGSEIGFHMSASGIAFKEDGKMYWTSRPSIVWELIPTGEGEDEFSLNIIHDGIYGGFSLEAGPDGRIYTFESPSELICFTQDGEYEIILDCREKELPNMRHLSVDSKGIIYVSFQNGELSILEPDDSLSHYASINAAQIVCGFDDNIYVLTDENNPKIVRINGIDSFETVVSNISGIKGCPLKEMRIAASPEGGIYVYNQCTGELYYINPDGKEEFFMDLSFCNLTHPNIKPWEIAVTKEGEIYAESWNLYRIDKDKNVYLHAFKAGDPNAIEVSPDGNWLYLDEWGAIQMIPIDPDSKKYDREIYKGFPFYPNVIWEEGYNIIMGGANEGVREDENFLGLRAAVTPDGSSIRSFFSFDIEGLKGKDIEYAELVLDTSKVTGDVFSYGPLCIAVVDWGDREHVLDDFYMEGELTAEIYEQNFKINNDKLIEEIQKAVDAGKSRFRIMMYLDIEDKEIDELIDIDYSHTFGRRLVVYTKQR